MMNIFYVLPWNKEGKRRPWDPCCKDTLLVFLSIIKYLRMDIRASIYFHDSRN